MMRRALCCALGGGVRASRWSPLHVIPPGVRVRLTLRPAVQPYMADARTPGQNMIEHRPVRPARTRTPHAVRQSPHAWLHGPGGPSRTRTRRLVCHARATNPTRTHQPSVHFIRTLYAYERDRCTRTPHAEQVHVYTSGVVGVRVRGASYELLAAHTRPYAYSGQRANSYAVRTRPYAYAIQFARVRRTADRIRIKLRRGAPYANSYACGLAYEPWRAACDGRVRTAYGVRGRTVRRTSVVRPRTRIVNPGVG